MPSAGAGCPWHCPITIRHYGTWLPAWQRTRALEEGLRRQGGRAQGQRQRRRGAQQARHQLAGRLLLAKGRLHGATGRAAAHARPAGLRTLLGEQAACAQSGCHVVTSRWQCAGLREQARALGPLRCGCIGRAQLRHLAVLLQTLLGWVGTRASGRARRRHLIPTTAPGAPHARRRPSKPRAWGPGIAPIRLQLVQTAPQDAAPPAGATQHRSLAGQGLRAGPAHRQGGPAGRSGTVKTAGRQRPAAIAAAGAASRACRPPADGTGSAAAAAAAAGACPVGREHRPQRGAQASGPGGKAADGSGAPALRRQRSLDRPLPPPAPLPLSPPTGC